MKLRKILLVEDNEPDAELFIAVLPRLVAPPPPVVEHRAALKPALDYLAANSVDLVVLDLGLPDSPSPAMTLRTLRETFPDVKIIILSGTNPDDIAAEAIAAGVRFVGKDELMIAKVLARTIDEVLQ